MTMKILAIVITIVLLLSIITFPVYAGTETYTSDTDFGPPAVSNNVVTVGTGDAAYLQLDDTITPFDFIWVAVSSRGTVVKIDTNTGTVLGEYMTSPGQNGNPSRTTVDNNGNVWVANRNNISPNGKGTVIHIASVPTDQDGDGVITTSSGLGNILAWGTDEAVLHYVDNLNSTGTRHLSVDANNDVWVSGVTNRAFDHIDGNTGALIAGDSYAGVGYGGYGGLIDPNGVIWSARPLLRWDTANPLSGPNGYVSPNPPNPPNPTLNWAGYPHDSYGLGIDSNGNVWNTSVDVIGPLPPSPSTSGLVHKFDPNGVLLGSYPHGNRYAQGVVADQNGDIWVAHSILPNPGQSTVGHIKNDGTYVGIVSLESGAGPTGVAVDAKGKIWATGYYSGKVYRIDPAAGPIGADGVTNVGAVDLVVPLFGNLYNYSDMTGSTLIAPPNNGSWTVVNDSGIQDAKWTTISWTADEPGDSSIAVSVASSVDGVIFGPPQPVSNGQDMQTVPVPDGQYLKIVVTFTRSTTDDDGDGIKDSPILYDLTKTANEPPDTSGAYADPGCLWPPNHKFVEISILGVTDANGDPVTITITEITSDEPTASDKGSGGAKHAPDADGIGTATASVRAERSGDGDGRVYVIKFEASDGLEVSEGSVIVKVPHDQSGDTCEAVDSGQINDATQIN